MHSAYDYRGSHEWSDAHQSSGGTAGAEYPFPSEHSPANRRANCASEQSIQFSVCVCVQYDSFLLFGIKRLKRTMHCIHKMRLAENLSIHGANILLNCKSAAPRPEQMTIQRGKVLQTKFVVKSNVSTCHRQS